jgi:hypothetical protein
MCQRPFRVLRDRDCWCLLNDQVPRRPQKSYAAHLMFQIKFNRHFHTHGWNIFDNFAKTYQNLTAESISDLSVQRVLLCLWLCLRLRAIILVPYTGYALTSNQIFLVYEALTRCSWLSRAKWHDRSWPLRPFRAYRTSIRSYGSLILAGKRNAESTVSPKLDALIHFSRDFWVWGRT